MHVVTHPQPPTRDAQLPPPPSPLTQDPSPHGGRGVAAGPLQNQVCGESALSPWASSPLAGAPFPTLSPLFPHSSPLWPSSPLAGTGKAPTGTGVQDLIGASSPHSEASLPDCLRRATHPLPSPSTCPSPSPSPSPLSVRHELDLTRPPLHLQDALRTLEMPRFTRRYPAILNTLIKQMLTLVEVIWGEAGGGREARLGSTFRLRREVRQHGCR